MRSNSCFTQAGRLNASRTSWISGIPSTPYASLRPPIFLPQAHLNSSQLDAIHKALRAEDYMLILAIRETRKTTAIALIREPVTAVELVHAF